MMWLRHFLLRHKVRRTKEYQDLLENTIKEEELSNIKHSKAVRAKIKEQEFELLEKQKEQKIAQIGKEKNVSNNKFIKFVNNMKNLQRAMDSGVAKVPMHEKVLRGFGVAPQPQVIVQNVPRKMQKTKKTRVAQPAGNVPEPKNYIDKMQKNEEKVRKLVGLR